MLANINAEFIGVI